MNIDYDKLNKFLGKGEEVYELEVVDEVDEVDENLPMTIPTTTDQMAELNEKVRQIIIDLTNIQTQYSSHPVITERAGFLQRKFHKWKMVDYEAIAESEKSVATNRNLATGEILAQLTKCAMFIREIADKDSEFRHQDQMRKLEREDKMAEIRVKQAEARLKEAEALQIETEAKQVASALSRRARRIED